jgi:hypothetical protein
MAWPPLCRFPSHRPPQVQRLDRAGDGSETNPPPLQTCEDTDIDLLLLDNSATANTLLMLLARMKPQVRGGLKRPALPGLCFGGVIRASVWQHTSDLSLCVCWALVEALAKPYAFNRKQFRDIVCFGIGLL